MVDKPTGFGGLTYHPMIETLMHAGYTPGLQQWISQQHNNEERL